MRVTTLRNSIIVAIIISFLLVIKTEAYFLDSRPIIFIQRTTDLITKRVSDIIYYLVMQKKYIFDDYTDPNIYPTWEVAPNLDKALEIVSASSSKIEPIILFGEPIVLNTSTLPQIRPVIFSGNDSEILKLTNKERASNNLSPLSANLILDKIAQSRVGDLFRREYFSHESPDGQSVSSLAKELRYNYILIGENLAMGDYQSKQDIVKAWMDSPGHQANILNPKYEELGVAVETGIFNEQLLTLAVQVFGDPVNNCSRPDSTIKKIIDDSSASVKAMQIQAGEMYNSLIILKDTPDLDYSYYNQKIQEYNYVAKKINDSISALKTMIDHYNLEVNRYNICIKT